MKRITLPHRIAAVGIVIAMTAPAVPSRAQHDHGGMTMPMPPQPGQPAHPSRDEAKSAGWHANVLGLARLAWNRQGGESGDEASESTNWNMLMAMGPVGSGTLTFMMMNSLEPATIAREGSPQLFQTGESVDGRPLVDHQHPHDFFMNLSATLEMPIGEKSAIRFQAAPVGEPALGPTAFMHRPSSGENPAAPLGHHWQDSTHITDSVVTLGGTSGPVTLEGSGFHGREPDDERWDIDGGAIDSWSGRVRIEPPGAWSGQVSFGYLHDPEELEPGDVHRTTASLTWDGMDDGLPAVTFVWGRNLEGSGASNSILLESAWRPSRAQETWARFEWVEKNTDLLLNKGEPLPGIAATSPVTALTAGYLRDLLLQPGLAVGLGGDITGYAVPRELEAAYGNSPISIHLFTRVKWGGMESHGMDMR